MRQQLHRLTANFSVIKLGQRAGVDEIPGHLTFVPFSSEVSVRWSRNSRESTPNRPPADDVVGKRFEGVRRLKVNIVLVRIVIDGDDGDQSVLLE